MKIFPVSEIGTFTTVSLAKPSDTWKKKKSRPTCCVDRQKENKNQSKPKLFEMQHKN